MVFKILSTLGIFLFGTVWAFRNLRFIFQKVNETTGIPVKSKTVTTESGTKLTITTTSNTSSNTGAE